MKSPGVRVSEGSSFRESFNSQEDEKQIQADLDRAVEKNVKKKERSKEVKKKEIKNQEVVSNTGSNIA